MQSRRGSEAWQRTALPEVGLVVAKWTAAKTGAIGSLWQTAPRWLGRYLDELSSAHADELHHAVEIPPANHHLTIGGKLIKYASGSASVANPNRVPRS